MATAAEPVVGKLDMFHPPAHVKDFEEEDLKEWDKAVTAWIKAIFKKAEDSGNPLTQFFNPKEEEYVLNQVPVAITWVGFPLKLRTTLPTDDARWAYAEDEDNQIGLQGPDRECMDEYLEWSTAKAGENDPSGALKGDVLVASFSCEAPEYWKALSQKYPIKTEKNPEGTDKILKLYHEMNPRFKDLIKPEDLVFSDGRYNPKNRWNGTTTTGTIAHLIQRNNTLPAEIQIAADATILRRDSSYGRLMTNIIDLCGKGGAYGNAKRNSDPVIGGEVNTLARNCLKICVADPIALYMHQADFSSFRLDPTGLRRRNPHHMVDVPDGTFNWVRGDIKNCQGLHLRVELPDQKASKVDRKLNLSDLFDLNHGGQYVKYGSQFADYIFMSVSGIVSNSILEKPIKRQDAVMYTEPFANRSFEGDTRLASWEANNDRDRRKKEAKEKKRKEAEDKIKVKEVDDAMDPMVEAILKMKFSSRAS